jgi:hypothetical protein
MHSLFRHVGLLLLLLARPGFARDYRFDGPMTEEVLRSYLSRSMTTSWAFNVMGAWIRGPLFLLSFAAL